MKLIQRLNLCLSPAIGVTDRSVQTPLRASLLTTTWLVEARAPYTGGHLWRVSQYCGLLAKEMGFPPNEVARTALRVNYAAFHQICSGSIHLMSALTIGLLTRADRAPLPFTTGAHMPLQNFYEHYQMNDLSLHLFSFTGTNLGAWLEHAVKDTVALDDPSPTATQWQFASLEAEDAHLRTDKS